MDMIDTAAAFRAAAHVLDGLAVTPLVRGYGSAVAGLRSISTDVIDYRALPEEALLAVNKANAEAARLTQTHAALIAGEIARRSAPGLGSQGLAQRAGHRTPEQFVKI